MSDPVPADHQLQFENSTHDQPMSDPVPEDPVKTARIARLRKRQQLCNGLRSFREGDTFLRTLQGDISSESDGKDMAQEQGEQTPFLCGDKIKARKAFVSGNLEAVKIDHDCFGTFTGYNKAGHALIEFDGIEGTQLVHKQFFRRLMVEVPQPVEDPVAIEAEQAACIPVMTDDELYIADKAARKIQEIFHMKRMRRLEVCARALQKVRMIRRMRSSLTGRQIPTHESESSAHEEVAPTRVEDPRPEDGLEAETAEDRHSISRGSLSSVASTRMSRSGLRREHEELMGRMQNIELRLGKLQKLEAEQGEFHSHDLASQEDSATASEHSVRFTREALEQVPVVELPKHPLGRKGVRAKAAQAAVERNYKDMRVGNLIDLCIAAPSGRVHRCRIIDVTADKVQIHHDGFGQWLSKSSQLIVKVEAPSPARKNVTLHLRIDHTKESAEWGPAGLRLGMLSAGKELIVMDVDPGALQRSAQSGRGHPKIRPGDRIVRVEDKTDCGSMAHELMMTSSPFLNIEVKFSTLKEASSALDTASPLCKDSIQALLQDAKKIQASMDAMLAALTNRASLSVESIHAMLPPLTDGGFSDFESAAEAAQRVSASAARLPAITDGSLVESASAIESAQRESTLAEEVTYYDMRDAVLANRDCSRTSLNRHCLEKPLPQWTCEQVSTDTLPHWLSPQLFGPCLRDCICNYPAGDIIALISELEHSHRQAGSDILNNMRLACSADGGRGIWTLLLCGGSGDQDMCLQWREVLWIFGMAVLEEKRCQVATLLHEWCLNSVSVDWGRQLVQIEETLGWCSKNLDASGDSQQNLNKFRFLNTDGPEHVATAALHVGRNWPAGAILRANDRAEVRCLEAKRCERSLAALPCGDQSLKNHQTPFEHSLRQGSKLEEGVKCLGRSYQLPENTLIAFDEFRLIIDPVAPGRQDIAATKFNLPQEMRSLGRPCNEVLLKGRSTSYAKTPRRGEAFRRSGNPKLRELRVF